MEKFLNLPLQKQNTIIDAALQVFGTNGYKKASVSEIAAAAGISKAMVFHYFGTKKDLYYYLIQHCGNLIINEVNENFDSSVTDFFDRITMATNIKMAVIKKHPPILTFLNSVYFEDNEEVKDGLKSIMSQSDAFRNKIAFDGMDFSKFKDGVDVNLVMKMLLWIAEGFLNSSKYDLNNSLDELYEEFFKCMNLLKQNLYKEQFI